MVKGKRFRRIHRINCQNRNLTDLTIKKKFLGCPRMIDCGAVPRETNPKVPQVRRLPAEGVTMSHVSSNAAVFSKAEQHIGEFNSDEIKRILPRIRAQAETKKDFVLPAPALKVDDAGRIILDGVQSFRLAESGNVYGTWQEAEAAAVQGEKIIPQAGGGSFPMSRTAERQLSTRTGVPLDYLDKLRREGQGDLAALNLSQRLARPRTGKDEEGAGENTDRFLVRLLDNRVRALLSDQYRIIDNIDLFYCAAEKLESVGGDIWQMRQTDDSFSLLAVARGIAGEVRLDRTYDPGDGWQSRWHNEEGDIQYAAMRLSNSETGGGSVSVAPAVMTRVCANFNVWAKTLRAVHLGKRREENGLVSAETSAAESRVIWMKVRDAITTVFDRERFAAYIETLNAATQRQIVKDVTDPNAVRKATEVIAERYEIAPELANSIFAKLMETRDFTQYGVSQAVTYQAHAADRTEGGTEIAETLEIVGGDLAHLSADEWRGLVKV
jgi:hypothetical protein